MGISNQKKYREMMRKTTGKEQEKWASLYNESMNEGLDKILDDLSEKKIPIWYMEGDKLIEKCVKDD